MSENNTGSEHKQIMKDKQSDISTFSILPLPYILGYQVALFLLKNRLQNPLRLIRG